MKTLLMLTVLLTMIKASGQDTIRFDKNGKKVSTERAYSYRVLTRESSLFRIAEYYLNGNFRMTGYCCISGIPDATDSLLKQGPFCYFDEQGNLTSQGFYDHDKKAGKWKTFFPGRSLYFEQTYDRKSQLDGKFTVYYPDGKIKREDTYKQGTLREKHCYSLTGRDTTWFPFYIAPVYNGGDAAQIKFQAENTVYPIAARKNGIQGIVYLSFFVGMDGKVEAVEILKGVYKLLDEEAIRVVSNMPPWKPGFQDGKPARIQVILPFLFRL